MITLEEALKLIKENPEKYELKVESKFGLACTNPREEVVKIGIPCVICSRNLGLDGKCINDRCN